MANREIKFYKHYFNEFYVVQTDRSEKRLHRRTKKHRNKQKSVKTKVKITK